MAKSNHQSAVRGILTGQSLNTPDDDIFSGPLHEKMPDVCITILETGGPSALDRFGDATASIQMPHIQVMVRNDDYTAGKSDADDIWALLHDNTPSGYSRTTMLQSTPIYLGSDDDFQHRWAVNIEMFIDE